MATDVEILYPFICPAAPSCNYVLLLAVQSGLPGCLAFEPLCLNTCAQAGAGAMHAHTRACEEPVLGKGPSRSLDRAGAGEALVGFSWSP